MGVKTGVIKRTKSGKGFLIVYTPPRSVAPHHLLFSRARMRKLEKEQVDEIDVYVQDEPLPRNRGRQS